MRPTAVPFTLFAFISATKAAISDQATEVATIKLEPGWKALPSCINHCIWDVNDETTGAIGGDLAYHMRCPNPWYNGCYCQPQSAAVAHSFISSCASYLCSTPSPGDIASGTSVYVSYCSKVLGSGYTPAPIIQAAPTSDVASAAASVPPSVVLNTFLAQLTSVSDSATSTSKASVNSLTAASNDGNDKILGLSRGAFIGILIATACSVFGLGFGVSYKIYKYKKTKRRQQELASDGIYIRK